MGIEVNGKLGMYLNIPYQCSTIYDSIIERLVACKSGENSGHSSLDQGCLVQIDLSDAEHDCVYDEEGRVKQYEKLSFSELEETVRSKKKKKKKKKKRKDIVEFL